MHKDVDISLPFRAPVGTRGNVRLQLDAKRGGKARLSIDMGHTIGGSTAGASLSSTDMHDLVDALLNCIYALERTERLHGEPNRQRTGGAAYG